MQLSARKGKERREEGECLFCPHLSSPAVVCLDEDDGGGDGVMRHANQLFPSEKGSLVRLAARPPDFKSHSHFLPRLLLRSLGPLRLSPFLHALFEATAIGRSIDGDGLRETVVRWVVADCPDYPN